MKQGITILTSAYTKDFLKDCLESIKETPYDILIVSNDNYKPDLSYFNRQYDLVINDWNGWEPSGLMVGREKFDEQIFLMDSTIVKDISLFVKLFEEDGNVVLTKGNFHYQGKFTKNIPNLPKIFNKDVAIMMETRWLPKPYTEFTPDLPVHSNVMEVVHGQNRMRLENDYMIKWKGTFFESKEHPIPK